jgi:hypothetical protein
MIDVKEYLEIKENLYKNLFASIENEKVATAILRFHYIKFDPNNEPKFDLLVDTLIDHITQYALSVSKRYKKDDKDNESYRNKMYREARNLFRKSSKTGEFGEMILWFFLESILKAPQVVAKMDLKTNRNDEVKGADGIHVNITNDDILEIIFGESKLYADLSKAITEAFKSIEHFFDTKQYKREYSLITEHFKWLKNEQGKKVLDFISGKIEDGEVKIKVACLIGFDWNEYKKLENQEERLKLVEEFEELYKNKASKIKNSITAKFSNFKYDQYEFDFFFLPFKSVDEIRKNFKDEL